MSKLARLYPYNPRRGWFVRTYLNPLLGGKKGGMKFLGHRGWYDVSDEVAAELEEVRQKDNDPRSGPAFLIARDAKHAKALEADLKDPEDEEASVGTADAPVRQRRPGRKAAAVKAAKGPKTRQRKTKADPEKAAGPTDG